LLNTLYGGGFLRHTNLLRAKNAKHHRKLLKQARQDSLQTAAVLHDPELRITPGADLARELAQVETELQWEVGVGGEHHQYFHDPSPLFPLCCIPNEWGC